MLTLEVSNQNGIQKRIETIRKNAADLTPIGEPLKQSTLMFNEDRAVRGVDIRGRPLAPLKPSTLEHRQGTGPPLCSNYGASDIVTHCRVEVEYQPGIATIKKSWVNLPWLKYAIAGSAHMEPRDPTGFSKEELAKDGEIIKNHLQKK